MLDDPLPVGTPYPRLCEYWIASELEWSGQVESLWVWTADGDSFWVGVP